MAGVRWYVMIWVWSVAVVDVEFLGWDVGQIGSCLEVRPGVELRYV